MYPVSNRFLDALTKSGRRRTVVDVYYNNILLESDVPVIDGSVTLDRNADCRLSASLRISVEDFDFTTIEPWGTELQIRSGVVYGDDTEELVPFGILRLQENDFSESSTRTPSVNSLDRSRALLDTQVAADADFSGRKAKEVISFVVNYSVFGAAVVFDSEIVDLTLPGGSVYTNTYWDTAKEIATGLGAEIYFDRQGVCTVAVPPSITSTTTPGDAVWTIGVGATLIDATRGSSRENTYSAVAMYGSQTGDQLQPWSMVIDDNPQSRTYYNGPFGKKLLRMTNNALTTNVQCFDAARQKLKEVSAFARQVSFECISNPALDVGDVVLFEFFDAQELHMIDQLQIPLLGGKMSGTTKAIQYIV